VDAAEFPSRKRGIFRRGKEIKGLRGGVHRYAAQASPRIDAATAEKNRFRTETDLSLLLLWIYNRDYTIVFGLYGTAAYVHPEPIHACCEIDCQNEP
jgi:hypothetical protein